MKEPRESGQPKTTEQAQDQVERRILEVLNCPSEFVPQHLPSAASYLMCLQQGQGLLIPIRECVPRGGHWNCVFQDDWLEATKWKAFRLTLSQGSLLGRMLLHPDFSAEEGKGGQVYGDGRRCDFGWWTQFNILTMYYRIVPLKPI